MTDFPRIVGESNGQTRIAVGYAYPSARSEGVEWRPLCTVVVTVATRDAQSELDRLREDRP